MSKDTHNGREIISLIGMVTCVLAVDAALATAWAARSPGERDLSARVDGLIERIDRARPTPVRDVAPGPVIVQWGNFRR